MRILIVEDEVKLAEALSQILSRNRYTTDIATDGETGLDMALDSIYDLIILDVMLPGINGFEILRRIRKDGIRTPVLLLTAKNEICDKVCGLDLGADDYMTKPFSTEELLARIRALSRRNTEVMPDNVLSCEDISLNLSTYELFCAERSIKLGAKEMNIVEILLRAGKRITSKEDLIVKVWGYDSEAEYNNVEVYISLLRKKLAHIRAKASIKTVRGVGYKIDVE